MPRWMRAVGGRVGLFCGVDDGFRTNEGVMCGFGGKYGKVSLKMDVSNPGQHAGKDLGLPFPSGEGFGCQAHEGQLESV